VLVETVVVAVDEEVDVLAVVVGARQQVESPDPTLLAASGFGLKPGLHW